MLQPVAEVKRARLGEGEEGKEEAGVATTGPNLEYPWLFVAMGEEYNDKDFRVFYPQSTPKYAARIIEAMEAAIRRGTTLAHKDAVTHYFYDKGVLADMKKELAKSPKNRDLKDMIEEVEEHVPAWILQLTREEKGEWGCFSDEEMRQLQRPFIYREYIRWE